jgi:hypothetical protein
MFCSVYSVPLCSVYFLCVMYYYCIKQIYHYIYVTLKEEKRSMSEKNIQNALWQYQKSHNTKFRVVDVL